MDKLDFGHHISQQFNEELVEVRDRVLAMGGIVEKQISQALTALVEGNADLAREVINNDYKVNSMEVTIDEECSRIIARRQPAASDLRMVVAVIKAITDLERIGDQAERVARVAIKLADMERPANEYLELQNLGIHVNKMLHDVLDAFARMDVEAALNVAHEDLKVDKEYEGIMRQVITFMMEDPRSITRMLNILWIARALERIGDHSKNIGEYVIYLVKGKDVRHTNLEQMEAEIKTGD
jgi:phosphate transport system protein